MLKYDISGCGGYDIAVPNPAADARLLTEWHRTTFVNYLRICFRYAGFPGWERLERTKTRSPRYLPLPMVCYHCRAVRHHLIMPRLIPG